MVAHRLRVQGDRRLHRDEGQHLQHVILQHVPQGAAGVVVRSSTALDTDGLRHCDLNKLYMMAIPQRFEDRVVEPEPEQILDRFLAEIMINSEDLLLLKVSMQTFINRFSRF